MVKEGFGHANSDPVVDSQVRASAQRFDKLGAIVETVSIPRHLAAGAIFMPIAAEGATENMMNGYGFGTNHEGLHLVSLLEATTAWRSRADELSESLKLFMLLGQTMLDRYHGSFYAKAANLRRKSREAYDQELEKYDLLLMPTLPITATPLPGQDAPREEVVGRALEMLSNTAQFDLTGHPAMSIPCGLAEDLPIGMMLIGRHHDEPTIYRAAYAFEQSGDWQHM